LSHDVLIGSPSASDDAVPFANAAAHGVAPETVPGEHDIFLCGNDQGAKAQVSELLQSFGWGLERIVDLGDITGARGQEMYLALWLHLMALVGGPNFNIKVVR
jgi:predicted dinucleotide-binding enzyme